MWKATRSWRRVGVERAAHPLGRLVDLAVVVVLLAALEHEVLEEVRHAVLLGPLGARAGVEGDEQRRGARALERDAVEREAVRRDRGADLRHGPERQRRVRNPPCTRRARCRSLRHATTPLTVAGRPRTPNVIEFRTVSKTYDARGSAGLHDATFSVARGEFVFLVGSTGSGKSTLMRLLIKELEPDRRAGSASPGATWPTIDAPQGAVLPAQRRRRLPGLQAAAQPHGARQRRLRAAGHGQLAQGDPRQGARHPAPDRALDEAPQLPRPALRRRAAARLGGARLRQPPAAAAGRRADRQPRPRDLDRDHAAALPHQPHRHDGPRRHPRLGHGRPDAPARARAARRAGSSATSRPAPTPGATSARPSSARCCASRPPSRSAVPEAADLFDDVFSD